MLENDLQVWVPFKVQNSKWLCRHSADPLEAGSFEAAEKRAEGSSERVSRLEILDLTRFRGCCILSDPRSLYATAAAFILNIIQISLDINLRGSLLAPVWTTAEESWGQKRGGAGRRMKRRNRKRRKRKRKRKR